MASSSLLKGEFTQTGTRVITGERLDTGGCTPLELFWRGERDLRRMAVVGNFGRTGSRLLTVFRSSTVCLRRLSFAALDRGNQRSVATLGRGRRSGLRHPGNLLDSGPHIGGSRIYRR